MSPKSVAGYVILGLCAVAAGGCYTLQPAPGAAPEIGARVAFDLNDVGRVAMGGAMGPEIAQVEGLLVDRDTASYLLSISSVRLLRGGVQVWNGEQIRFRPEYLGSAYQRRLSPGRSIALGVIGVGGFATLLASKSLLGLGSREGQTPNDTVETRVGRP